MSASLEKVKHSPDEQENNNGIITEKASLRFDENFITLRTKHFLATSAFRIQT